MTRPLALALLSSLSAVALWPTTANAQVAYAWGYSGDGQLGTGSTTQSNVPVPVSSSVLNGLTVTRVAAGQVNSYALTSTGRLFAWGDNSVGQLGLGSTQANFTTPQEVTAPTGYVWASIESNVDGAHVVAIVTPVPEPGAASGVAAGVFAAVRLVRRKFRPRREGQNVLAAGVCGNRRTHVASSGGNRPNPSSAWRVSNRRGAFSPSASTVARPVGVSPATR